MGLRTLDGASVDAVAFRDRRAQRREADRLRDIGEPAHEDEVKPADRALMERLITGSCVAAGSWVARDGFWEVLNPKLTPADVSPRLRVASFDIESAGMDGPLLSIAIVCGDREWVFVRGDGPPISGVSYHATEAEALTAFLDHVADIDPDVLIGWNVIDFDLAYLEDRCARANLRFTLGRDRSLARVIRSRTGDAPPVARVPGRVVLDGIATMRAASWSFERWTLEHVAQRLLGRGKAMVETADPVAEIERLYREDLPALVAYNLEDCRLVRDIFAKAHVLEFAIERQRLTGLGMDRRAGAVAAFDHLYLPRLHRRGRVAPSVGVRSDPITSPGGYVLDSVPGLYDDVLVLDFKSLYPSIIRTFRVDPLGLAVASEEPDRPAVDGYGGARFSRDEHILPDLIESLWRARDEAKRQNDVALSRAIKILMNSFYGVLGTPACRFYDPRLASSITRRGHDILMRSRAWIEAQGYRVIYGDTDSLFVHLTDAADPADSRNVGARLADGLNRWWAQTIRDEHGVESALEVEFETHYLRFFMPTIRGSKEGSKKRYAGLVVREPAPGRPPASAQESERVLVFKGLEAVRTDWTPLARRFQRELFRRVFAGEPYAAWIASLTQDLFAGRLDDELVYRKRLRRRVEEYTRSAPPHVVAARQLSAPGREIEYVVTTRGPQPIAARTASLDYAHYLERQLAPAADPLLAVVGESFMRLGGRQLSLF